MSPVRVLYISPHPDDVAFSCFGAVRAVRAAPEGAVLVTVFSESDWTAQTGFAPQLRDSIAAVRRQEDAAFATWLRLRQIDFRLPDSGVRGYTEHERYSGKTDLDPIGKTLAQRLKDLAGEVGELDRVFLPLGLGNHVDHVLVRDLGKLEFLNVRSLFFYEDLPYASQIEMEQISAVAESLGIHLAPTIEGLAEPLWAEKAEAIRLYHSQLGPTTLERIASHARRILPSGGMAERYWTRSIPVLCCGCPPL